MLPNLCSNFTAKTMALCFWKKGLKEKKKKKPAPITGAVLCLAKIKFSKISTEKFLC